MSRSETETNAEIRTNNERKPSKQADSTVNPEFNIGQSHTSTESIGQSHTRTNVNKVKYFRVNLDNKFCK